MPMFENVTTSSRLTYSGPSWTLAWGDVNGDGLPDIWLTSHNSHAFVPGVPGTHLFLNSPTGIFRDVSDRRIQERFRDFHGASWGDFDNDGDPDLIQLSDAKGGLLLYENVVGQLRDVTADHGLARNFGGISGRNTLWFDYNNDGLLDLYIGSDAFWASGQPASGAILLRQNSLGQFIDARDEVGFNKQAAITPLISDLNGDGHLDLIVTNYGQLSRIYDTSNPTFRNIAHSLLSNVDIQPFDDMIIADFNNDLRPDIYITRQGFDDEAVSTGHQIRSYITPGADFEHKGFSFASTGDLTVNFSKQDGSMNYGKIHVGASAVTPITDPQNPTFTLSTTNPDDIGLPAFLGNSNIYIGYDQASERWEYVVVGGARPSMGVTIDSTAPVTGLATEGFPLYPGRAGDQLLINTPTGFVDRSAAAGISSRSIYGAHLAVGDFDNDGDVDIYVDQASPALNRRNFLLVNRGDGTFGLDIRTGAEGSSEGAGGPVAVADFDRDGFLDLATSAGRKVPPFIPLTNGPLELFHNLGNGNHWIELRLHGVESNADAIGAKVIITTGAKQQMREVVNGTHIEAQDYNDVHFGLGRLETIDKLEVHWPSGAVTTQHNVPADQIMDITEQPDVSLLFDLGDQPSEQVGLAEPSGAAGDLPADAGVSGSTEFSFVESAGDAVVGGAGAADVVVSGDWLIA